MSKLFTPIATGSLSMPNRVVIAPMCQYSAEEGRMTDWHMIHLGQLALSGAGLLTIEATAVSPEGRITYADVGLWDDGTEEAMVPVLRAIRRWSDIPVAIQLAHAGRKASTDKPWQGGAQIPPGRPNGWQTVAPSAALRPRRECAGGAGQGRDGSHPRCFRRGGPAQSPPGHRRNPDPCRAWLKMLKQIGAILGSAKPPPLEVRSERKLNVEAVG